MKYFRIIPSILFCLLTLSGSSYAIGDTLRLYTEEVGRLALSPYLEIMEDTSGNLSIEDIHSGAYNNRFIPYSEARKNFTEGSTYWARVCIENKLPVDKDWIILTHDDLVTIYEEQPDGSFRQEQTGSWVTSKKIKLPIFPNGQFRAYASELVLWSEQPHWVYIQSRNLFDSNNYYGMELWAQKKFYNRTGQDKLFDGIFQGVVIIMVLYNLLMLLISRDSTYFYYVLYILFYNLWILVYHGYVWGAYPILFGWSVFMTNISTVFYIQFSRQFLYLKKESPTWDKLLKAWQIIAMCFVLLATIIHFFFVNLEKYLRIDSWWGMAENLLMLALAVFILINGKRIGRFYAIGLLGLIAGMLITYSIVILNAKTYQFNMELNIDVFLRAGFIIEILFFSLGLAHRMRLNEKEKQIAKENIIRLQDDANKKLEAQVEIRTLEIQEKNDLLQQQNEEIQLKHEMVLMQKKEMTDSIMYAKRIQEAILPPNIQFGNLFSDYFIFFKPRDIVSGDFYWIEQINDSIVLAVADCTGHGVPGAFMSMLGTAFLNEIVHKQEFGSASGLLEELRFTVKNSLRQTGRAEEAQDGMDIAICIINKETLAMQFAGAYNPLYLIQDNLLTELKADRQPASVYLREKPFSQQNVQLKKGDKLYLCTDGFADQLGGSEQRRFLSRELKKLLYEVHILPMQQQIGLLEQTLNEWMQPDSSQIDDVLIVGISI